MTTDYAERIDQAMQDAYGPFQPGTVARAIRWDNWQRGLKTCWNPRCLAAFRPERVIGDDGKVHRFGRGRWYCSARCAQADRREQGRQSPVVGLGDDETLVIDLRRCRGCAA